MQVTLCILGAPRTKAGKGRAGGRGFYMPKWVKLYEAAIGLEARRQLRAQGVRAFPAFAGPVQVSYDFYYARKPTTQDLDNALKSLNDALQGIAYRKDCDIWKITHLAKHQDKTRPRIEVVVQPLTEGVE